VEFGDDSTQQEQLMIRLLETWDLKWLIDADLALTASDTGASSGGVDSAGDGGDGYANEPLEIKLCGRVHLKLQREFRWKSFLFTRRTS
jgi:hypothetical protein